MNKNVGQKIETWNAFWEYSSPENYIKRWDYWGLRQWILKYTPRNGKVLEAGCGMGRNNFLLSKFGIDIEGLDFSQSTIELLKKYSKKNDLDTKFIQGDVSYLPYEDNSLNGYISLGVIEHFIEGPQKPLQEAYRVLKPGGIAIISTPSISWYRIYLNNKTRIKSLIKRILKIKQEKTPFFQYFYRPRKLKNFVKSAGFEVTKYAGADLLYTFCDFGKFTDKYLKKGTLGYWFSNKFENSFFSFIGAQSITISVKLADIMNCFICNNNTADKTSLKIFDLPICDSCKNKELSKLYLKTNKTQYGAKYIINPPIKTSAIEKCVFCNKEYISVPLFEDLGFTKKVCPDCLKKPSINMVLSCRNIQPIWRNV